MFGRASGPKTSNHQTLSSLASFLASMLHGLKEHAAVVLLRTFYGQDLPPILQVRGAASEGFRVFAAARTI